VYALYGGGMISLVHPTMEVGDELTEKNPDTTIFIIKNEGFMKMTDVNVLLGIGEIGNGVNKYVHYERFYSYLNLMKLHHDVLLPDESINFPLFLDIRLSHRKACNWTK
ncbi:MAG: hypothetical protein ABF689_15680, partial [Gluconobacter cerinus]|uniref:hypothetical protein n=1 Tax=Gluconobacter cerinus TaxID=38307 RepID=UPI0039EC1C0E